MQPGVGEGQPIPQAVEARIIAIETVLTDPNLRNNFPDSEALKVGWLDGLKDTLRGSVQEALAKDKSYALVLQYTPALLGFKSDTDFANAFLHAFNANIDGAPITTYNLATLARGQRVPVIKPEQPEDSQKILDAAYSKSLEAHGGALVKDHQGNPLELIAITNIPRVRIVLDGSAISQAHNPTDVKALLLLRLREST